MFSVRGKNVVRSRPSRYHASVNSFRTRYDAVRTGSYVEESFVSSVQN